MTQHDELVDALKVLTKHYATCQQALEEVAPSLVSAHGRADACVALTQILSSIDVHQQTYAGIMRTWQSAGFVASSECRQWKNTAQAALESLLHTVQRIEQETAASRSQLMPALNLAVRDQQARAAYQRAHSHP